ncbi:MAG: ThiF family adenylyltransferase [Candidatus Aminicenantales bacterium]
MTKKLTPQELETYSRQIVLDDIGYDGQLKLRQAKVCLIGVGGLGSVSALQLTAMGIGYLRLVDRDIVSRSDLHRQYLYDVESLGLAKVEVACQKLSRLNPDVRLDPIPEALNSTNAGDLMAGMDAVIDGLDRPEPRYIINRTCLKLKIPYVFGSAIEAFGNASTMLPGQTFCLECFMPGLKDEDLPSCGVVGVHPSIVGVIASIQVSEAVRLITGRKPKLFNKLLYADLRQMEFTLLDIQASDSCKICGSKPAGPPEKVADKYFEETCARDGRRTFILSPKERLEIDIGRLKEIIKNQELQIKKEGKLGIAWEKSSYITASILKSGIMIVQTAAHIGPDIKDEIFKTYRSILVDGLGVPDYILPDKT